MIKETTKYKDYPVIACDETFLNEVTRIDKLIKHMKTISNYMPNDIKESNLYLANEISKHIAILTELELAIMEKHDILKSKVENQ